MQYAPEAAALCPHFERVESAEIVKAYEIDKGRWVIDKLMVETMAKAGYAAVAKVGMHQREYIVIIRPREKGLTLHSTPFTIQTKCGNSGVR